MKLLQLGISSALCICLRGICGATTITLGQKQFNTVIEAQTFIEDSLHFNETQINNSFPYTIVYSLLDQSCGELNQHKQITQLKSIWGQDISNWKIQTEMQRYFEALKKMIISTNKLKNEQEFCQQKYILYSLLEHTQILYKQKDSTNPIPTKESDIGEQKSHDSAGKNTTKKEEIIDLITLNDNQQLTNETDIMLSQLAEKIIQKEIGILLEKGLLNLEDIKVLNKKIEINYVNGCGATKGSYHMMQKVGGSNRTLKAIKLNINLCSNTNYLQNFEKYTKQIFIHELAHYFYYFKDNNTQDFDTICWENENNICKNNYFVSSYAQNNKEEDYAESFTYWYLGYINSNIKSHGAATSSKIGNKEEHFEHTFSKR